MNNKRAITSVAALTLALAACASDNNANSADTSAASAGTSSASSAAGVTAPTTMQTSDSTAASTASTDSMNTTGGSTDASTNDTASVRERVDDAQQALEEGNFSAMLQALRLSGVANDINDHAVTIRERDSMEQERVPITDLVAHLQGRLAE